MEPEASSVLSRVGRSLNKARVTFLGQFRSWDSHAEPCRGSEQSPPPKEQCKKNSKFKVRTCWLQVQAPQLRRECRLLTFPKGSSGGREVKYGSLGPFPTLHPLARKPGSQIWVLSLPEKLHGPYRRAWRATQAFPGKKGAQLEAMESTVPNVESALSHELKTRFCQ